MRGRKRIISVVLLFSVILAFSGVFASGVVDVSKLSLLGAGVESLSPGPGSIWLNVTSVAPPNPSPLYVGYYLNRSKTVGQTVRFHVNITGTATMNLFAWQLNVTWDSSILSARRIFPGEFLNRTSSPNKTAADKLRLIGKPWVMNKTDNAKGYSAFSDSILGNYPGINGSGRLATIEFTVVGYGWTNINISLTGTHRTRLLDRGKADITPSSGDVQSGYFRNKKIGDIDGDGDVDGGDYILLSAWWTGPPAGPLATNPPYYNRECDLEGAFNGYIDGGDYILISAWWTGPPKGPLDP